MRRRGKSGATLLPAERVRGPQHLLPVVEDPLYRLNRPHKNRTGAPGSPRRTWAEKTGDPDFLLRGTHQRPCVRLSVRKAARGSTTPPNSTGNPGEAHKSFSHINN